MQSLTVLRSAAIASIFALAGAATEISTASAADIVRIPQYMPPPPPPPPPLESTGGFYLRGDVGSGMYDADKLGLEPKLVNAPWGYYSCGGPCGSLIYNPGVANTKTLSNSFENGYFAGIGAGYQINSWLRTDATLEYRMNSEFKTKEQTTYSTAAGTYGTGTNDTTGNLSAMVAMVNGYVDLGTWHRFTPFVGAGVGVASINISDVKDIDSGNPNKINEGKEKKTTGLAWALQAGVAYDITQNLKIEVGYRYLNLGKKIDSASIDCGGCAAPFKVRMDGVTSHDVKAGVRWSFNDAPCCGTSQAPIAYPAPAPAPIYSPPPLTRKY